MGSTRRLHAGADEPCGQAVFLAAMVSRYAGLAALFCPTLVSKPPLPSPVPTLFPCRPPSTSPPSTPACRSLTSRCACCTSPSRRPGSGRWSRRYRLDGGTRLHRHTRLHSTGSGAAVCWLGWQDCSCNQHLAAGIARPWAVACNNGKLYGALNGRMASPPTHPTPQPFLAHRTRCGQQPWAPGSLGKLPLPRCARRSAHRRIHWAVLPGAAVRRIGGRPVSTSPAPVSVALDSLSNPLLTPRSRLRRCPRLRRV